jgi:hypothetical protein
VEVKEDEISASKDELMLNDARAKVGKRCIDKGKKSLLPAISKISTNVYSTVRCVLTTHVSGTEFSVLDSTRFLQCNT